MVVWMSAWPIHSWTRLDVGVGDEACAEGVAQVVEAQRTQAGAGQRELVAAA
jgi:hypothetical protein